MKVQAKPGGICCREDQSRNYIRDDAPVEVPDTLYYRRLVNEGSLILVDGKPVPTDKTAKKGVNK
jgi:hypothetical protein